MALDGYDGVKVFSCTMSRDRDQLGEKVTAWLRNRPDLRVVSAVVVQSSDQAFHCLSVAVFYAGR